MPSSETGDTRDLDFVQVLRLLYRQRRLVVGVTIGAAFLALLVAILLPNRFTATARILPPQTNQSSTAALLGQLSPLVALTGNSLGLKNPNDLYVGMLSSRTIADNIISQFELFNLYDMDSMVATRNELSSNTRISAGKDGLITIEFEDEDPERSARVANAYVAELDKLTQGLAVTEAAQRRLFFERQLLNAKEGLASAEVALKQTQEKTGLIKLDEQGKAIVEAVATLRAQVAAKEVELRAMRTFTTEVNPDYVRVRQQLAGLRLELNKLESSQSSGSGDLLLSTGGAPEAGLEYVRKLRDVRYHETIFELLAKQFEVAKIDEAKEAAVIQIVDRAIPPDLKSKPRRAFIVLTITLLSFGLVVFCIVVFDQIKLARLRQQQVEAS